MWKGNKEKVKKATGKEKFRYDTVRQMAVVSIRRIFGTCFDGRRVSRISNKESSREETA